MEYEVLKNASCNSRLIEQRIVRGIEDFGAVCVQGTKYCGKLLGSLTSSNGQSCTFTMRTGVPLKKVNRD